MWLTVHIVRTTTTLLQHPKSLLFPQPEPLAVLILPEEPERLVVISVLRSEF